MSVQSELERINNTVMEQTALIKEISDILDTKASGGGSSNTVFQIDEIYYAGTFEIDTGNEIEYVADIEGMFSLNEAMVFDISFAEEYGNSPFVLSENGYEPFKIDITKDVLTTRLGGGAPANTDCGYYINGNKMYLKFYVW